MTNETDEQEKQDEEYGDGLCKNYDCFHTEVLQRTKYFPAAQGPS